MIQDIFPHRFNNHYQPDREITADDFVLHYKDNTVLLKSSAAGLELPRKKDFKQITSASQAVFLFTIDEHACFLLMDEPLQVEEGLEYKEINFFRTAPELDVAWAALVGYHLLNWYKEHRFCGKCGALNHHKSDERAMQCPSCGALFFPKISPAVIVAIIHNDKILLARNNNFKGIWYSLIAGYADVGETLEETLVREVREEVGIEVKNIRYYKSQPWPLSASMMVGFIAEADDTQPINVDHSELVTAEWFHRDNLPEHSSTISIAGEMISKFEKGEL
jgi:NAD+ diphosphatase